MADQAAQPGSTPPATSPSGSGTAPSQSPPNPGPSLLTGRIPVSSRVPSGVALFEVAWEVCNKVGGIYQVLRSKAPTMLKRWRSRYCMVGPFIESNAALEFEPVKPKGWLAEVIDLLGEQGLTVHHGGWLVSGNPRVLLIEHTLPAHRLDEVKFRLWKDHGIELPAGDRYIDDAVSFAEGTRRLLTAVATRISAGTEDGPRRVLAHFHEWLGGLAIPMLRHDQVPVASVFTTHATLLGRYMASNEEDFYDTLHTKNQDFESRRYNIRPQHSIERACAHGAHVFTTVSPITAEECTQLLSRTPEYCLPNGLNIEQFNVGHDFQTLHAQYKERIHHFVMGHFFPSYSFDLEKTIYLFTSGRFEPRNKGFDLTLEAMARLNTQLKAANLGVTIVLFIVTNRPTRSILPTVLQSRGVLNELQNVCDRIMEDVGRKLFPLAAAGERVDIDELVDSYWALRYRRTQQALRTKALPPIVTHFIDDEARDPLLNYLRVLQLFNRKEDPVKIVYHPDFITSTNPLWGLEYEQFVRGCHMGVFPSAYEPWGYTPLECVALGVPAITSDLAGFGRHILDHFPHSERWGLTVLKRRSRSYSDAAAELSKVLMHYCRMDRRSRINLRNQVERRSWEFDWSKLGRAYNDAHDLALTRAASETKSPS